jgi:hypothetical protein
MKRKLIISLIIILVNTFNINSQTTLDIVRASNYYSKAITAYRGSSYNSALNHLKNAETNLKGKTNKDLEYLKIMTYYKLKNYQKAYSLIQIYFEKGYPKDRIQYFKNIESYREKYNTDYDKVLTNIFIELEDKYGAVTNTSIEEVISLIINRIKAKEKNIKEIIRRRTIETVEFRSFNYQPIDSYNNLRTGTVVRRYGEYQNRYRFERTISSDNRIKYICNNSWYKKLTYYINRNINKNYYDYSFSIKNSSTYISYNDIKLRYSSKKWFNHYLGRSSNSELKKSIYNDIRKDMKNKDKFTKRSNYGDFTVRFNETETLILEQQGNLEKLKIALRKNKLL